MNNKVNWRIGKLLDNRYEIKDVVGVGGMAVVYKAFDMKLKRNVAIKVLQDDVAMDAESRRRFRTEYQAVAMLSHPNIRAVYDVVSSGDTEYIVMEYVDGINLKQYLKKKKVLSWKEALHFATQIARALSHAHSKGIIHMDIKPQNIMLPKDGTAKVADFGIAMVENSPEQPESDEAVGSIHYISPEQARGESIDARTDIYSLGVVLYEMLTGQLPYDGGSAAEVAVQQMSVVPDAPTAINPEIPEELEEITLKAMQTDPDERYQSADDMLAALEDFRKGMTSPLVERRTILPEEATPAQRGEMVHLVRRDVPRISRAGELSKQAYVRRRTRAGKISLLLGIGLVLCFAIFLGSFVWNYWLRGIFRDPERTAVPDFSGLYAESVVQDPSFAELFKFDIVYQADDSSPVGTVVRQDPEPGASRMITEEGIEVKLIVSSGIELVTIPDIINDYYPDVQTALQELGLNVMTELSPSDTVTADFVISCKPGVGSAVAAGTYVTITVSAGPSVDYVDMPNLVGASKAEALTQLSALGLVCTENEITYVSSSEEEADLVLWQNYEAGEQIVANTRIYLHVGSGPVESESSSGGGG